MSDSTAAELQRQIELAIRETKDRLSDLEWYVYELFAFIPKEKEVKNHGKKKR